MESNNMQKRRKRIRTRRIRKVRVLASSWTTGLELETNNNNNFSSRQIAKWIVLRAQELSRLMRISVCCVDVFVEMARMLSGTAQRKVPTHVRARVLALTRKSVEAIVTALKGHVIKVTRLLQKAERVYFIAPHTDDLLLIECTALIQSLCESTHKAAIKWGMIAVFLHSEMWRKTRCTLNAQRKNELSVLHRWIRKYKILCHLRKKRNAFTESRALPLNPSSLPPPPPSSPSSSSSSSSSSSLLSSFSEESGERLIDERPEQESMHADQERNSLKEARSHLDYTEIILLTIHRRMETMLSA